jgi:hypothetical protein
VAKILAVAVRLVCFGVACAYGNADVAYLVPLMEPRFAISSKCSGLMHLL